MIRGIYTAAAGMMNNMAQQDVIANNLANINTTGYKRDQATFRARMDQVLYRVTPTSDPASALRTSYGGTGPAALPGGSNPGDFAYLGYLSTGSYLDEIRPDFAQGDLKPTDNPLDLGLRGKGFFVVDTPQGLAYTRNGAFQLDGQRRLVDNTGNPVLGQNGEIRLPQSGQVRVAEDGTVSVSGTRVDQLRLADFGEPGKQLSKYGDSYYHVISGSEQSPAGLAVQQGFIENSTVNAVSEMVKMILTQRNYEGAQKVLSAQDESLGHSVNDIARL